MKKTLSLLLAILTIACCLCPSQAYAYTNLYGDTEAHEEGLKPTASSLEVTLFGFTLLYQTYMEMLGETTNIRREWTTDSQVTVYLTDTTFCMFEMDSKSDYGNIKEVLFTGAPQSSADLMSVNYSMVSVIYVFDPDLSVSLIASLVTDYLPKNGSYISDYCSYKYREAANIRMLTITPRG